MRGVPEPTVAWYFEGDVIETDDVYQVTAGPGAGEHSLYLHEAFPEDSGLYTVRVTSPHGAREANAMLTVLGKLR